MIVGSSYSSSRAHTQNEQALKHVPMSDARHWSTQHMTPWLHVHAVHEKPPITAERLSRCSQNRQFTWFYLLHEPNSGHLFGFLLYPSGQSSDTRCHHSDMSVDGLHVLITFVSSVVSLNRVVCCLKLAWGPRNITGQYTDQLTNQIQSSRCGCLWSTYYIFCWTFELSTAVATVRN
jgi:hypothetical protein